MADPRQRSRDRRREVGHLDGRWKEVPRSHLLRNVVAAEAREGLGSDGGERTYAWKVYASAKEHARLKRGLWQADVASLFARWVLEMVKEVRDTRRLGGRSGSWSD